MKLSLLAAKPLLPPAFRRYLRDRLVRFQVRHVCGPELVSVSANEAVVTCLVKNGALYLEEFIAHYERRLGARHILLLDNASSDDTVALARAHPNVSVWSSDLAAGSHQGLLQRYLVSRLRGDGWCVQADIDEFFDYPGSERMRLPAFLAYLNGREFTAALTQMLDMFNDAPLSSLSTPRPGSLRDGYPLYDLAATVPVRYGASDLCRLFGAGNRLADPDACLFYGGVRKSMYGAEWRKSCLLTKHALFRLRSNLRLFHHVHFVDGARVADVSCVLRHYKLAGNPLVTAVRNQKEFHSVRAGYEAFAHYLLTHPDARLSTPTTRKWARTSDLVVQGFLFASSEYMAFVDRNSNSGPANLQSLTRGPHNHPDPTAISCALDGHA